MKEFFCLGRCASSFFICALIFALFSAYSSRVSVPFSYAAFTLSSFLYSAAMSLSISDEESDAVCRSGLMLNVEVATASSRASVTVLLIIGIEM